MSFTNRLKRQQYVTQLTVNTTLTNITFVNHNGLLIYIYYNGLWYKNKTKQKQYYEKILLCIGVIILFGLSACGGDLPGDVTVTDDTQEVVLEKPFVRVVFNPATADINLPNDFLMIPGGNFFDFTLNTEGADTFDPMNPQHALSAFPSNLMTICI